MEADEIIIGKEDIKGAFPGMWTDGADWKMRKTGDNRENMESKEEARHRGRRRTKNKWKEYGTEDTRHRSKPRDRICTKKI